jgi:hypothetical protein
MDGKEGTAAEHSKAGVCGCVCVLGCSTIGGRCGWVPGAKALRAACRNADACSSCASWRAGLGQHSSRALQGRCVCVCGNCCALLHCILCHPWPQLLQMPGAHAAHAAHAGNCSSCDNGWQGRQRSRALQCKARQVCVCEWVEWAGLQHKGGGCQVPRRCDPLAGATHQGEDDEQLAFRDWRPWRTGVVLAGGGDLGVGHRWQGRRGRSDLGAALHACAAASGARSTHAAAEGWVEGWAGPAQQQGTARQV